MSITHGVHKVKDNIPFEVYVANFGRYHVTFPRKIDLAQVVVGPAVLRETDLPAEAVLENASEEAGCSIVANIQAYNVKETKTTSDNSDMQSEDLRDAIPRKHRKVKSYLRNLWTT